MLINEKGRHRRRPFPVELLMTGNDPAVLLDTYCKSGSRQSQSISARAAAPRWSTYFDESDRPDRLWLVFPCRRIPTGWLKSETDEWVEAYPTHWRKWEHSERPF